MRTLTQFINEQIDEYELHSNSSNYDKVFSKIRIKAQRELQKLGYWDNAPTKLIGKAKTKVFTEDQLLKVQVRMRYYLEGLSDKEKNLNHKKVKATAYRYDEFTNNFIPVDEENYSPDNYNSNQYVISKKEIDDKKKNIMLEAIFNYLYTPIDEDKLETLLYTAKLSDDPFKVAQALEQLKEPEGHLFKKRTTKKD